MDQSLREEYLALGRRDGHPMPDPFDRIVTRGQALAFGRAQDSQKFIGLPVEPVRPKPQRLMSRRRIPFPQDADLFVVGRRKFVQFSLDYRHKGVGRIGDICRHRIGGRQGEHKQHHRPAQGRRPNEA